MKLAKISARATFYKCINGLHDFGYIKYQPSSNNFTSSEIYLNGL